MSSSFADDLLHWYAENARDLPWRKTTDPYAIWVSEVMLQQTRVETVLPYYQRWIIRFGDVHSLASADLDDVLRLWEGLGYYQRAHNLHKAAKVIVEEHSGSLPEDIPVLEKLPGIGPYIASAIAAIAFDLDVLALDGNLRRVLARILDIPSDPRGPSAQLAFHRWAEKVLPTGKASSFNQALMDLGSTVCVPANPKCTICPVQQYCEAFLHDRVAERPIRIQRAKSPHYVATAAVILVDGRVLLARRPPDKLLGGLWEYPGGKLEGGETPEICLRRELQEELGVDARVGASMGVYEHAYTHYRITLHAYHAEIRSGEPVPLEHSELAWVAISKLPDYPMGKVDRLISADLAKGE